MKSIDELENGGVRVLLMRRTGNDTVRTDVGYRDATGKIRGWFAKGAPTHWIPLPPWGNDGAAITRRTLQGD